MNITFVLPGDGRSGGVRVTAEMANQLLARGHGVRIAFRRPPTASLANLKRSVQRTALRCLGNSDYDWLPAFRGPRVGYQTLGSLSFSEGEIVIAVGSRTVEDVDALTAPVRKVRYCHGFSDYLAELTSRAWSIPMPTIAVSPTLIPRLQSMGCEIIGTVPNGINPSEYFVEPSSRNGVGLIFNNNPKKAPAETIELVRLLRSRLPDLPCYVFSDAPRQPGFPKDTFWRLPSVDRARWIYNQCRVWVVTSKSEGFCLPILEAMACGCAVVSSDHDTVSGLIQHEVNGLIVPIGDNDAFLRAIRRLLEEPEFCARLVAQGHDTARRFSWAEAVLKMENVLGRLAGTPISPAPATIHLESAAATSRASLC